MFVASNQSHWAKKWKRKKEYLKKIKMEETNIIENDLNNAQTFVSSLSTILNYDAWYIFDSKTYIHLFHRKD